MEGFLLHMADTFVFVPTHFTDKILENIVSSNGNVKVFT